MNTTKPTLEKIIPSLGTSYTIRQHTSAEPCAGEAPFWHFHPELELVYVRGGNGKRHIGSHLSWFQNGTLVLIGSNLPHLGFTDRLTDNELETVVQMKAEFLGESFFDLPEMKAIKQLFQRAELGISFYGDTKDQVGHKLEELPSLAPFPRLIGFLEILQQLANSEEYEVLNVDGFAVTVESQENDRFAEIYQFVQQNFQRPISLDEISALVNMTVPAFCRYFKKVSRKTFVRFLNEYRIMHACKLLSENHSSIAEVCFESGFNSLSQFNSLFKEITGKQPSAYRKDLKKVVS